MVVCLDYSKSKALVYWDSIGYIPALIDIIVVIQMEYFSNLELVQSIARQIVQDRRCNYSEEPLRKSPLK